jgi:hypothetical protein
MQSSKTSLGTEFEPTTSCVDGYSGKHAGGTYSYHCALKGQDKESPMVYPEVPSARQTVPLPSPSVRRPEKSMHSVRFNRWVNLQGYNAAQSVKT